MYISIFTYIYHPYQPIYLHLSFMSAFLLTSITHVSLFNHIHHLYAYLIISISLLITLPTSVYLLTGKFITYVILSTHTHVSLSNYVHHLHQPIYLHSSPTSNYVYHLCQPIYLCISAFLITSITQVSFFNHIHHSC
jgi:hypothetical protein